MVPKKRWALSLETAAWIRTPVKKSLCRGGGYVLNVNVFLFQ